MDRREAIARVAILLGGTVIGANAFLSGCKPSGKKTNELLNQEQLMLLNEIGDTILPTTATPGAKAADVAAFMHIMIRDCYEPKDQELFVAGLEKLEDESRKKHGKKFMDSTPAERTALLIALDAAQKKYTAEKKATDPAHYFRMYKELTLLGYFTSEVGSTKALRYVLVPGKFDACIPYKKGDRAWALN
ncbi:gluconate 2-dehydrogenase subunit 3 family protein [Chitinophaga sp. MM2321]|uniref:gluconate 2-dehydrogenase subunit 3 family protein n=1 Tax=Chitinophaga sp. MM2321 TaxID=3137178 RepID=UPI0032D571A6